MNFFTETDNQTLIRLQQELDRNSVQKKKNAKTVLKSYRSWYIKTLFEIIVNKIKKHWHDKPR